MNAMSQNSVNKDKNKARNTLITSISVAALAVGLSFPIGAMVLSNAEQGGSQMGGAPGAVASDSQEQLKLDATAAVKQVYDFRPSTDSSTSTTDQTLANVRDNSTAEFFARYEADRMVLKYDPLTHSQSYADYTTYGPAYVNGDTVYVAVDQYTGPEDNRQHTRDLVVAVDADTMKITGVGAEYKAYN
ncbi:MAG: hypothetical protein WAR37_03365 [Candidatus Microsaccharimonas sp.]